MIAHTSYEHSGITTNGTILKNYSYTYGKLVLALCNIGDQITISGSQGSGSTAAVIYYLNGFSRIIGEFAISQGNNTAVSDFGYTNGYANFMCGAAACDGTIGYVLTAEGDNYANSIASNSKSYNFAIFPESDYCKVSKTGGGTNYNTIFAYATLE